MRSFFSSLTQNLYGGGEEKEADIVVYKLLEAYIVYRAIEYSWQWGFFIQDIGEVVLPLGIANHIDISFMFENGVSIVTAIAATLLMAVGFLRLWKWAYLMSMVLFHLQFAARFCLGEIPHSSNFVGLGILALGLAPLLFNQATTRRRFVTGTLVFFIGLAYFTGAITKLVATGLTWPDGRHLWIWIAEKAADKYAEFGALTLNPVQRLAVDNWWFATASLTFGLVAELASPAIWYRRTRALAALAMLSLHTGIYLTMRIVFSASMVIIALVGFPWARWMRRTIPDVDAGLSRWLGRALTRLG